jgi:hypothetical protein
VYSGYFHPDIYRFKGTRIKPNNASGHDWVENTIVENISETGFSGGYIYFGLISIIYRTTHLKMHIILSFQ